MHIIPNFNMTRGTVSYVCLPSFKPFEYTAEELKVIEAKKFSGTLYGKVS